MSRGRCDRPRPAPAAEPLEARRLLAGVTYFVSPAGDDANAGTDEAAPWRTSTPVNALDLEPGDRVLFQGGQTFNNAILLGPEDAGTADAPVTVASYGDGRATIRTGGVGLYAYAVGGVHVRDLNFVGAGRTVSTSSGISFYNDLPGDVKLAGVSIDRVDVSAYGKHGVSIGGYNGNSGYRDLRLTRLNVFDNALGGISLYGYFATDHVGYANANVYVAECRVFANTGVPGLSTHSGSGIVLGQVDGAVIERCVAYENGSLCDYDGAGPVGIWAWDSNDVTIQYNESHHNRTAGGADGGGFDLDGGVTNSTVQYNYSHDNDGAGYLLAQFPGARPYGGNTYRFNVSQNDARRNNSGGFLLWNGDGASGVGDTDIYNNTVYLSPFTTGGAPAAVRALTATRNVRLFNNILITTGGRPLLVAPPGQQGLTLLGNAYWPGGGSFRINWLGTTYTSLSAWRTASGRETLDGGPVGFGVDPKLISPGAGGTLNNAYALGTVHAYRLRVDSPLAWTGVNLLERYGIDAGPRDYFEGTLRPDGWCSVGAHAALPAPWGARDVGPVARSGSVNPFAPGAFRVAGSGADIWGTADEFHFMYQSLDGDGQIIARVSGQTRTHTFAKAGVMIRETLSADSRHASLVVTPGNGVRFVRRAAPAEAATGTSAAGATVPAWLKLTRRGATITAQTSSDGVTWRKAGSAPVPMASAVFVGLAVTSHADGVLGAATFDRVSVTKPAAASAAFASPATGIARPGSLFPILRGEGWGEGSTLEIRNLRSQTPDLAGPSPLHSPRSTGKRE